MISISQYMAERDKILGHIRNIELSVSHVHAKTVALFVNEECEKIREVYEKRQAHWNHELNEMAKEYGK